MPFVVEERGYATPCLIWTGAVSSNGYGMRRHGGQVVGVHRVAWEEANGPVPDGLYVLHRCDVPLCGEPTHLFLGTQADNMADAAVKGRIVVPRLRGEAHPRSRITAATARAIREASGSQRAIARQFGVSQRLVGQVRRGERWADA